MGMKHHVRGCLEDNAPDTAIFHFGTNNPKNNESAEDIATDICKKPFEMTDLTRKERMKIVC